MLILDGEKILTVGDTTIDDMFVEYAYNYYFCDVDEYSFLPGLDISNRKKECVKGDY